MAEKTSHRGARQIPEKTGFFPPAISGIAAHQQLLAYPVVAVPASKQMALGNMCDLYHFGSHSRRVVTDHAR